MFKYDLTWNIVGYLKPRTERTYLLIEIPENTELEGGGSTMGYQGGGGVNNIEFTPLIFNLSLVRLGR